MRGELTHDFVGAYDDFIQREARRGPILDVRDSTNIEQAWSLRPAPNGLRESADSAPLTAGDPRLAAALYRRAISCYERAIVELARSDSALDLRKRSYRLYAVNQMALGNFSAALGALERLQALPGMDEEWPRYYYLGVCYRAEFRVAARNTGVREATLIELRRRSNLYRLRAVELKYGVASVEFRTLFDAVRREELGGPRTEATLEYTD